MYNKPLAYFVTSTTYGTWLHGDVRNSVMVKKRHAKQIEPNAALLRYQRNSLKYPPVILNDQQRQIVVDTIVQHCQLKSWQLYAVHVRSKHVHLLVKSDETVEKITSDLKAWCTRRLREAEYNMPKVWTRQASTVYVFSQAKLIEKLRYVVQQQGQPMNIYVNPQFRGLCYNVLSLRFGLWDLSLRLRFGLLRRFGVLWGDLNSICWS